MAHARTELKLCAIPKSCKDHKATLLKVYREQPVSLCSMLLTETFFGMKGFTNLRLRKAAVDTLVHEADRLSSEQVETAAVMRYIARNVLDAPDRTTEAILHALGPDYFRHAALQVEEHTTELALLLMEMAQQLRPEGDFISERIQLYRDKLKKAKT